MYDINGKKVEVNDLVMSAKSGYCPFGVVGHVSQINAMEFGENDIEKAVFCPEFQVYIPEPNMQLWFTSDEIMKISPDDESRREVNNETLLCFAE